MLASDLVTDIIPPLRTSDTVEKALLWMSEFKVSHLPIVNNVQLLGLVSEEDLIECNTPKEPLGSLRLSVINPSVYEWQHFYEVLKLITIQKLSVVPVVDAKNNYMGLISLNDLATRISHFASLENPGGIIILEVGIRDYSLSEIARIVESNDASILSSYITSQSDSTKMDITLKVNKIDLTTIIASFQRFNYNVKASYHQSEFQKDTMDRYELLMHYLNM